MPMMKCGHAANARDSEGRPVCVICAGIADGWNVVDDTPPDLAGRTATCDYCHSGRPSSPDLAFFEYRPDKATDSFYCGCRGWD